MTRHVRHIFTQGDQTGKNSRHAINLLIVTFQSHPTLMGCCNTITQCLIVTTINPICRSRPVHPGTKKLTFVALRARKTSSLHTIILKNETQTKHLIALIYISVYFSL